MGEKVSFDWANKIVQVDAIPVDGIVKIDVKIDIYSDGKEDWKADTTLNKFLFPVTPVGGDALPEDKSLGSTFFLEYGWVIRPYNASHTLSINGNMYARDGSDPYVDTVGTHTVRIMQSVSSLVDSTVQQLKEIERIAFGECVTYDEINGVSGTAYPIGTPGTPSNNTVHAQEIAIFYGFTRGHIKGDMNVPVDANINGFDFIGDSESRTTIVIPEAALFINNTLSNATITGYLDGDNTIDHCTVTDLHYIRGKMSHVTLDGGTVTLGSDGHAQMEHCHSGDSTPNIVFGLGSTMTLAIRDYNGSIMFHSKNTDATCSIDMSSGQVWVAATVSAGKITLRGVGELVEDLHTGTAIIDDNLINNNAVSNAVWVKPVAGLNTAGSFGEIHSIVENVDTTTTTIDGKVDLIQLDITNILDVVNDIIKYHKNRTVIDKNNFTLTIYENDNTTPYKVFDLKDDNGVATITSIFERLPQ